MEPVKPLIPSLKPGWENLGKKPKNELINKLVDQISRMDQDMKDLADKLKKATQLNVSKQRKENQINERCAMARTIVSGSYMGGNPITVEKAKKLVSELMKPLDDFREEQVEDKS